MENTIKLRIQESSIIIEGDIKKIDTSSNIGVYIRDFRPISEENQRIIISDPSLHVDSNINEFRETIEDLSKYDDLIIVFESSFLLKIESFTREEDNFAKFSEQALSIRNSEYDLKEFEEFTEILKINLPKRRLYKQQLLSAYHLSFSLNACNFSVPGAGKTSIVYGAYAYLNSLKPEDSEYESKFVNKIIVIGPLSSFTPWEEEYEECFGKKPISIRLSGATKNEEKIDALSGSLIKDYNLFLINYNSVPGLLHNLIRFCDNKSNKVMLVCDEAHKIKNVDGGVWAPNILELSKYSKSRVILTGTPVPNGYEDLFNLFSFIYPTKEIIEFPISYLKRLNVTQIPLEIQELINMIKPYFIRITKKNLDLPEITSDEKIRYDPNDLEKKLYLKILDAQKSYSTDINKMGLFLRLAQSIYNPALLKKKNIEEFDDFKMPTDSETNLKKILGDELHNQISDLDENYNPSRHFAVLKKVRDIIRTGKREKVIIWGWFVDSAKRLHRLLSDNGIVGEIIIGETEKEVLDSKGEIINIEERVTRESILKDFKNKSSNLKYIITNPTVLGESISLHKVCHHSIYYELSYSASPYIQSRDRIHRVWLENGKQKEYHTHYYHLLSNPTSLTSSNIDEEIYRTVRRKWEKMLDVIENEEIPLLNETNKDEVRLNIINKIINDYAK